MSDAYQAARAALDRWMDAHFPSLRQELAPFADDLDAADRRRLQAHAADWINRSETKTAQQRSKAAAAMAGLLVASAPKRARGPGDCPGPARGPRCHPDCPGPIPGSACQWTGYPG